MGGWPTFALLFLQRWGAEDSCSAGLPSHLRRFPLKYKTWLASAESTNPKRDRLVESHLSKTKGGPPAGGSALLGFVVLFQGYYYFSSSVSFFQIPDSLRDFTQAVTPVDNRCYFSGRHELAHDGQVLFV